jgi:hypothetical protein
VKYDLAMPETEFLQADRIVRSMLLGTRIEQKVLRLATSNADMLAEDDQATLKAAADKGEPSVGHCFGLGTRFDIWVSPHWDVECDAYKDTVLHELTHGYLGVYNHNHRFLRFFGRVLHHYSILVSPLDLDILIPNVLRENTKQSKSESFKKYCDRLEMEQEAIAKIAVDEFDKVSLSYLGMTDKEETRERNRRASRAASVGN